MTVDEELDLNKEKHGSKESWELGMKPRCYAH